jgi:hypothetical protein
MSATRPLDASSPELPLGLLASRGGAGPTRSRVAPLAHASSSSACYLETRIGPSDVFGQTCTEPWALLTSRAHRASAVSLAELASDLGCYTQPDPIGLGGGLNLFQYALGRPTSLVDKLGLAVWICNRQVRGSVPVGNHAYFWDDTRKQACGQSRASGAGDPIGDSNEAGPTIDRCVMIPGSGGREPDIMGCCAANANAGKFYFPGIKDCHSPLAKCIEDLGLGDASAEGGRTGMCPSCWLQPITARLRQLFQLFEAAGNPAGDPTPIMWPKP